MKYLKTTTVSFSLIISFTSCLHKAADNGNIKTVTALIQSRADVNTLDSNGNTPIHGAAMKGQLSIVRKLISSDANVDPRNNNGDSPLHLAAQNGHKQIVSLLLKHKAAIDAKNNGGYTPLHLAIEESQNEVVNFLLEKHADKTIANKDGNTALHIAAIRGSWLVEDLVKGKLDLVKCVNNEKKKAYELAFDNNYTEVGKFLKGYTDVSMEMDEFNNNRLHRKIIEEDLDGVEELAKNFYFLMDAKNKYGRTPLHLAIEKGNSDIALSLIKYNANIDEKITSIDEKDYKDGYTPLYLAIEEGVRDNVDILIDAEVDLNTKINSITPLHLAVKKNHTGVVEALLESKDVDINCVTKNKHSPLHVAIDNGNEEIVRILLDNKAEINLGHKFASRPLTFAVEKSKSSAMIKLLLERKDLDETSLEEALTKAPNRRIRDLFKEVNKVDIEKKNSSKSETDSSDEDE